MTKKSRVTLRRSLKRYWDGTHRVTTPERTERAVMRKIRASGLPVVFQMTRIDGIDKLGLPVYSAQYPDVFNNTKKPGVVTCCKGKGSTVASARVSALMERVERFSASDMDLRDVIYAPFESIRRRAVSRWDLVPCNLQRRLYTKREVDRQILPWTACHSLSRDREVLLPANMVYFRGFRENNDFSYTNGLAAGNTIEEAVLHGLCEVVERHLQEVVYRNGIKTPRVPLESISDAGLAKIVARFASAGLKLYINDVSLDFGIPAFGVFAADAAGPHYDAHSFYTAVGVHPDKRVALSRALLELAQERASVRNAVLGGEIALEVLPSAPPHIVDECMGIVDLEREVRFDDIADIADNDIAVEIGKVVASLGGRGCEVIVKDLTHPMLGVPVVRVVVTGLQPGIWGIGVSELDHEVAQVSSHLNSTPSARAQPRVLGV